MIYGILIGVAATSACIYVYESLMAYIRYREMREWLRIKDVDPEGMEKAEFAKYYTLWQLSKLPNVEIEEVKKE